MILLNVPASFEARERNYQLSSANNFPKDFLREHHFLQKGGESTMINKVITRAKSALRRMKSKKGQTLVEYALILAFISVVAISVLIALGNQVKGVFTTITSQLAIAG